MKIFFVADFLFAVSSYALIVAGILGLYFSSLTIWLSRAIFVLSITLLVASTMVAYTYAVELFIAYYSGDPAPRARATGFGSVAYWILVGSALIPQFFWVPSLRSRPLPALLIALAAAMPPLIKRFVVSRRS